MKDLYLVLPGGSLKGVYQTGFLEKLVELNDGKFDIYDDEGRPVNTSKMKFRLRRVFGTSVGAINGSAFAANKIKLVKETFMNRLKDISDGLIPHQKIPFRSVTVDSILSIFNLLVNQGAYKKLDENILLNEFKTLPEYRKQFLFKNFFTNAVDLDKGIQVEFNNFKTIKDVSVSIAKSAAAYGAISPYYDEKADAYFGDGALIEEYPLSKCEEILRKDIDTKKTKASNVIVLVLDFKSDLSVVGNTSFFKTGIPLIDYGLRLIDLIYAKNRECEFTQFNNRLENLDIKIQRYTVKDTIFESAFNPSQKTMRQGFREGQENAKRFFKSI